MAVGIITGAAFGKIVSSLVGDVVMPPIGATLGGVDFSHLSITVREAVDGKPAVVMAYGKFLLTVLDFLIISSVIFAAVRYQHAEAEGRGSTCAPSAPSKGGLNVIHLVRDSLKCSVALRCGSAVG